MPLRAGFCNDENLVSAVLVSAIALAPCAVFQRRAMRARLDIFSTRNAREKKDFCVPFLRCYSAFFEVFDQVAARCFECADFSL